MSDKNKDLMRLAQENHDGKKAARKQKKRIAELEQKLTTTDKLLLRKNAEALELKQANRLLQQQKINLSNTVNALRDNLEALLYRLSERFEFVAGDIASDLQAQHKHSSIVLKQTPAQHKE